MAKKTSLWNSQIVGQALLDSVRKLNPRWDDTRARARLQHLGIPLSQRAGRLSGGQ